MIKSEAENVKPVRTTFRSGGSSGYRGGGSLASQFSGLKSVHYVGDLDRTSVNAHEYHGVGLAQNEDGVYRYLVFCLVFLSLLLSIIFVK